MFMSIEVRGICALLQVFDMPTSVRFYRDILGFEVVQTSPREGDQFDWGALRLKDAQLMLNTAYEQEYRPAQPEVARVAAMPTPVCISVVPTSTLLIVTCVSMVST